jgi:acetylglutamate synthase
MIIFFQFFKKIQTRFIEKLKKKSENFDFFSKKTTSSFYQCFVLFLVDDVRKLICMSELSSNASYY